MIKIENRFSGIPTIIAELKKADMPATVFIDRRGGFKVIFHKKIVNDSWEKEVAGFLNYSEGGKIYIGIADDGIVAGVSNSDDIQKRIVDRIKNNISPSTMGIFDVVSVDMDGKDVIKVIISSGPENLIKQDKYITQAEINEKLNKTTRTIRRNMKMLQEQKLIL